jgi:hypothetical protein
MKETPQSDKFNELAGEFVDEWIENLKIMSAEEVQAYTLGLERLGPRLAIIARIIRGDFGDDNTPDEEFDTRLSAAVEQLPINRRANQTTRSQH